MRAQEMPDTKLIDAMIEKKSWDAQQEAHKSFPLCINSKNSNTFVR